MKLFIIISIILNTLLLTAVVILTSISLYYEIDTNRQFRELNENAQTYNEWIQKVMNPQIGLK